VRSGSAFERVRLEPVSARPSVVRPAAFSLFAGLLALAGCQAPETVPEPASSTKPAAVAVSAADDDPAQGKWRPADVRALPYLQGYRPAQDHPVVVEQEGAFQGLNLYVSGHAAEAVLMDMKGHTLHRWRYPLRRLWPDLAKDPGMAKLEYWRRAYLYPNGDLLGIYEGLGLVKLDARSHVLWAHRGGIHHDLAVLADGTIYALDRDGKILPRINPKEGVLEDFVTVLDRSGRVVRRISILECFERSPYAGLLRAMPRSGDIFHTNTLEVLDGRFADRNPAFRKGNLLVSVLKLDTIAVLDPDRRTVVWARTGMWRRQHQPAFLDNGHLLLFDNTGAGPGKSRVLELDPLTGKTVWQFGGRPHEDLFSKTLGSCQRLPNGDTLITESENGRAIEVTREGRIVWEFYNPHRAGGRGELVAVLFEMVRLPPDFPFQGETRSPI
jgi:arylsulfotransferase ASST